ncbi:MAG: hypothetical protein L6Q99_14345 [Planctomycetes bacterium]|nr:hypothetical protein [Planctomycetota bacterium]
MHTSPIASVKPPTSNELDRALLVALIDEALRSIDRCLSENDRRTGNGVVARPRSHEQKLVLLRALLESKNPVLTPEFDASAPLGHACPEVDRLFGLAAGRGLDVLEGLADLGLLERELHNYVHVCPKCRCCHLNLREGCPACTSIDLSIESLVQHFRCAYVGLEREFAAGEDLMCPKCVRALQQLGSDFDRPGKTYACHACAHLFEEPALEAQCLTCGTVTPSNAIELVPIHRYQPSPLTARAVELGRLTGLDIEGLVVDDHARLETRGYFVLELRREIQRLARSGGCFSTAVLDFRAGDHPYALFRIWTPESQRALADMLKGSRAPLDLFARLDGSRVGILLPETDEAGERAFRERTLAMLAQLSMSTHDGHALVPAWRARTWVGPSVAIEDVLRDLALEDEPR